MGGNVSKNVTGGFRIFKVIRGSPAERVGLEIFFDFLMYLDDLCLIEATDPVQKEFFRRLNEGAGKTFHLKVYNIRTRSTREIRLSTYSFDGPGVLGATVRYDTLANAMSQGFRVMNIHPNSPAAHAGLIPYSDYILGAADVIFKDLDCLVECINKHINKTLSILVYNSQSELLREIQIVPNHHWGGDGSLGADIGTGFLHQIPPSCVATTGNNLPNDLLKPQLTLLQGGVDQGYDSLHQSATPHPHNGFPQYTQPNDCQMPTTTNGRFAEAPQNPIGGAAPTGDVTNYSQHLTYPPPMEVPLACLTSTDSNWHNSSVTYLHSNAAAALPSSPTSSDSLQTTVLRSTETLSANSYVPEMQINALSSPEADSRATALDTVVNGNVTPQQPAAVSSNASQYDVLPSYGPTHIPTQTPIQAAIQVPQATTPMPPSVSPLPPMTESLYYQSPFFNHEKLSQYVASDLCYSSTYYQSPNIPVGGPPRAGLIYPTPNMQ